MKALVIVPTFNESETIAHTVERLFEATESVDLLVVDDYSPDGTAAIVRSLASGNPRIHLLERSGKRGLGEAYVAGFRWALEHDYEVVIEMDADGSHDPREVPRLIAAVDGTDNEPADLAIGSRYIEGGGVSNWSPSRRRLSKAGNVYAHLMLGLHVKDATSGFRALTRKTLERLLGGKIRSGGYAFQIEVARRVRNAGGRIVEVPITFEEREAGLSKMSRKIVLEAIVSIALWGLKDALSGARRSSVRIDQQEP